MAKTRETQLCRKADVLFKKVKAQKSWNDLMEVIRQIGMGWEVWIPEDKATMVITLDDNK